jgi:hypothetical protein
VHVRVSVLVEPRTLERFERFCLPSLVQPGNLPRVLRDGATVTFSLYAPAEQRERLRAALERHLAALLAGGAIAAAIAAVDPSVPVAAAQHERYLYESREAARSGAAVLILGADTFYGDDSLGNLAVYARKPGVVVAGLSLRVREHAFAALLGSPPVTNARLVDVALESAASDVAASRTDVAPNAALDTGLALRPLSDDVFAVTENFARPVMFWPDPSDLEFGWGIDTWIWPAKAMEERRWRLLASSDLFFCAQVVARDEDVAPAIVSGKMYEDGFRCELPQTLQSQMFVATLRRERTTG